MIHQLKTLQPHFDQLVSWEKTAELRNDSDRVFKVGDVLVLREWTGTEYTGRLVQRIVSGVTQWEGLQGVMLSFYTQERQALVEVECEKLKARMKAYRDYQWKCITEEQYLERLGSC